jgi:hypothetical protein
MIKTLKPTLNSKFKQGYYPIEECKKYFGKGPIIYRSAWEKMFCDYCEKNQQIKTWTSENVRIPYEDRSDGSYHDYYPDFLITTITGLTILIEVKPEAQIKLPEKPKILSSKRIKRFETEYETFRINMLKFSAAKKYCDTKGWVFRILTESFFSKLSGGNISNAKNYKSNYKNNKLKPINS